MNDSKTIYNESSQVLIDPQDKVNIKLKPFKTVIYDLLMKTTFIHCCTSFLLLEQAFRCYCVDPLVSSDADRWGYTLAKIVRARNIVIRFS